MHAMNHSLERDVTYPLYQWLSRAGAVGCPQAMRTPPGAGLPLAGHFGLSLVRAAPRSISLPKQSRWRGANLPSLADNPATMRVLQERLPQLAHRDISEALANVEQLVEYIPDDALATLFQALYKEVSYNAAAQELNIVKYSA